MKKAILITFILIILISLTGCKCLDILDKDCIHGHGPMVQETRNLDTFHAIESNGSYRIFLTQGDRQEVIIEAESSIVPLIRTTVHGNGYLVIDTKHCIRNHQTIRVFITVRDLRNLTINGSGDVTGETPFDTEDFTLQINGSGNVSMDITAVTILTQTNGSGDIRLHAETKSMITQVNGSGKIHLSGAGDDYRISINASGDIDAFDFPVSNCQVAINGSGNSRIHVTGELGVSIIGSGDVYFMGNPVITHSTVIGSGKIIQVD